MNGIPTWLIIVVAIIIIALMVGGSVTLGDCSARTG